MSDAQAEVKTRVAEVVQRLAALSQLLDEETIGADGTAAECAAAAAELNLLADRLKA